MTEWTQDKQDGASYGPQYDTVAIVAGILTDTGVIA
jgi:hypothetical protein